MSFFAYPGSWNFWKITKFFFESYRPEIHQKLQKWCCGRISKLFGLFRAKNKFCINFSFSKFFCISGVMEFLKNHSVLFWELRAWNSSETSQMVLRTYFKAFQVVWSKKKILHKFLIFWVFLHIRGHEIFEKSLSSFFRVTGLKFIGNFKNGIADVFQSFLGCFEPKKILYLFLIFWVFLHIQGHGIFEKSLSSFLRVTSLKFIGNFKNGVADVF